MFICCLLDCLVVCDVMPIVVSLLAVGPKSMKQEGGHSGMLYGFKGGMRAGMMKCPAR